MPNGASANGTTGSEAESPPALSSAEEDRRRLKEAIAWRYAAPAFILLPLVLGLYLFTDRVPVPPADQAGDNAGQLAGRLNPNTATRAELAMLPRVGETLARRIVAYREEKARDLPVSSPSPATGGGDTADVRVFRKLEDLDAVPGIGPMTLHAIAPYLDFE